jgi:hypothetical protein
MINCIYAEISTERITYGTRPEFINGQEQKFHDALKKSIIKLGIKDPIHIWYQSKQWGDALKVKAGQNRMVVAKELDIKTVPCIVTQFDAENSKLKGRVLETDKEIKSLFHLPKHVVIRREDEWPYSILCNVGGGRFVKTYHEFY